MKNTHLLCVAFLSLPTLVHRPLEAQAATPAGQNGLTRCKTFILATYVDRARAKLQSGELTRDGAIERVMSDVFAPGNDNGCVAMMYQTRAQVKTQAEFKTAFRQILNKTQNLTQTGGNASSSGSTNLVSKNLTSELLSVASEYGGLTQSKSGQTTTLSGSLSGIPLALEQKTGAPIFAPCAAVGSGRCIRPATLDWLSRFSYSFAVSTGSGNAGSGTASAGQGTTQPVTLSSTASTSSYTLSAATGKVVLIPAVRNAKTLKAAADKIDAKISANADQADQALTAALLGIEQGIFSNPVAERELRKAAEVLLDSNAGDRDAAWDSAAAHLLAAQRLSGVSDKGAVQEYLVAIAAYSTQEDLVWTGAGTPALTFEYDFNRPTNQPTTSAYKLIGAWSPGQWTLTLNAAASLYNAKPPASIPSASRLRDVQVSAEADYKVKKALPITGAPTLTAAYYYQDQTSPSILTVPIAGLPISGLASTTNQIFTKRGPINIGQMKVSFGTASSGFSVPLSMTVSNRTELLTGMDVKGQVGLSYNFDSLLTK